MKNEFIPYEEAIALKELGFNEPCFSYFTVFGKFSNDVSNARRYNSDFEKSGGYISAPLYQQAFRWFREKYNKLHTVNIDLSNNLKDKVYIYTIEDHLGSIVDRSEEYNTYEEAELACLRKLIKIVENENK